MLPTDYEGAGLGGVEGRGGNREERGREWRVPAGSLVIGVFGEVQEIKPIGSEIFQ